MALHSDILRIASGLPVGHDTRRKLLAALKEARKTSPTPEGAKSLFKQHLERAKDRSKVKLKVEDFYDPKGGKPKDQPYSQETQDWHKKQKSQSKDEKGKEKTKDRSENVRYDNRTKMLESAGVTTSAGKYIGQKMTPAILGNPKKLESLREDVDDLIAEWEDSSAGEEKGAVAKKIQKRLGLPKGEGMPQLKTLNNGLHDLVENAEAIQKAMKDKKTKSRVGSQVGKIIFEQFGGRRAQMMLGMYYLQFLPKGMEFGWPNKQRSKGNHVRITLRGDDTYDLEFFNTKFVAIRRGLKVPGEPSKLVKRFRGIYSDQLGELFEKQTGWYLRL